jgi:hypothetical protein
MAAGESQMSWRMWRYVALLSGVAALAGFLFLPQNRWAWPVFYTLLLGWLAVTRERDAAIRWIPLMYAPAGVALLMMPIGGDSRAHLLFSAVAVLWVAGLSASSVWVVRRLRARFNPPGSGLQE